MKKYKFVGVVSHVAGLEYNAVGQTADFDDAYFRDVIKGGASFLPEPDFDEVFGSFPPELLAQYSNPYFFGEASEEYKQKVEACREKVRQLRASIEAEDAALAR